MKSFRCKLVRANGGFVQYLVNIGPVDRITAGWSSRHALCRAGGGMSCLMLLQLPVPDLSLSEQAIAADREARCIERHYHELRTLLRASPTPRAPQPRNAKAAAAVPTP